MKYQIKNAKQEIIFETSDYKQAEEYLFSTPEPVEENILFQNHVTKEITHSLICVRNVDSVSNLDALIARLVKQELAKRVVKKTARRKSKRK